MERKFRIIETLWYDDDNYNEHRTYRIQEWKKSILGHWRWKYFKAYDHYDGGAYTRSFNSTTSAKQILDKYIKQKPHKIVVEEITY